MDGASAEGLQRSPSAQSLRTYLLDIDDQIADLHAKLHELATARKAVVAALKSITYPVLTLPVEIISQIFGDCVERVVIGYSTPNNAVVVLAQVCRMWRNIALSLPSLWSKINIGHCTETLGVRKLLPCYLERAGTQELELDMSSSSTPATIFSALAHLSGRWKSFECTLTPEASFLRKYTGRLQLPVLRSLSLWTDPQEGGSPSQPFETFLSAPLLREVLLVDVSSDWISLPWQQLTKLSCYCFNSDAEGCMEILRQSPNLESLTIGGPDSSPTTFSNIRLERLHTFTLENNEYSDVALLDFLTLPALKNLHIAIHNDRTMDRTISLITRSNCTLQSATFNDLEAYRACQILEHTPTVTELSLLRVGWDSLEMVFDRLARPRESATEDFLPELCRLHIEPCAVEVPGGGIVATLAARRRHDDGGGTQSYGRTALEQLEFVVPSQKPDDGSCSEHALPVNEAVQELRALLAARGEPKIRIDGTQNFNMSTDAPTRQNISYTLDDLVSGHVSA